MLLNKDIFFIRLVKAVSEWYDEHYFAPGFDLERKKEFHIQTMKDNYNHWRFIACKNLNEEKTKFLTEVQTIVDNTWESY